MAGWMMAWLVFQELMFFFFCCCVGVVFFGGEELKKDGSNFEADDGDG